MANFAITNVKQYLKKIKMFEMSKFLKILKQKFIELFPPRLYAF
jgi:hypothetical protein